MKNPPSKASRAWEALTPELSEWILTAVSSMGFEKMTPVQASTIPLFMENKDVVVEAVTGSGKTLAFLIPVLEKLLRVDERIKKYHIGAIVISPTRELASQIHSVLVSLLGFHPPSAAALRSPDEHEDETNSSVPSFPPSINKVVSQLVVGGTQTPAQDVAQFMARSPNLLIGTPGRLLDLLNCQTIICSQASFEVLVLDEADRLLDLGFQNDLQKILKRLPKQRRTGLFSASVSEAVNQIIRVGLRNPVRISVKVKSESGTMDKRTPMSLQLSYVVLNPSHKLPALRQLLHNLTPTPQKSIVYVSTCAAVDYFQHILPMLLPDFTVVPLHGKLTPKVRDRSFIRFTESITPTILLTTDVAARGLDIPMVDLVIQLDPPTDPKVFIHRCGRAGRAGRRGIAVIFLSPGSEENYISFLSVRKSPVSPLEEPSLDVSTDEAAEMTEKIRALVTTDLALHQKAQKAFVSWVQAYSKHQASSIFPVSQLDWQELGNAWGLLKLPKMPELKIWDGDRSLGCSFDLTTLKFKDPAREKRRLAETEQKDVSHRKPKKTRTEAWSAQKAMKETREFRREKRKARREVDRKKKMSEQELHEQMELEGMIAQVRAQNVSLDEEWEGLDK